LAAFISLKRNLRDPRSTAEVSEAEVDTALEEAAEGLKCRTIQNRLIRVVNRPVIPRLGASGGDPDDQALIERAREEIAKHIEALRQSEGRLPEVVRSERETVDRDWASRKLDMVPGDELLDAVAQRFGVRFHKDRDCARLASLFRPEEIPNEIRSLIQEISAR
jgi:hypothetical protein